MKRPLAIAAISFFAFTLLALNLPQQVLLPIAAILVCCFIICFLKKQIALSLIFGAAIVSIIWNVLYINIVIKPNFDYINQSYSATAQVMSTSLYSTGFMSADLKIYTLNGDEISQFNVYVDSMPHAQVGEYVKLDLSFKHLSATTRLYSYTDKVFIGASYIGDFKSEHKYSIFYYANKVKQHLSSMILLLMPNERGAVANAMSFGDKAGLSQEIKDNFKAAGLSHMLVVSGMHLAAASGVAYLILSTLFKNRKLSAICSIGFIIAFVFVTGITQSALRAGIMLCITYGGMCFYRKSDSFTSVAFAGLLMFIINPYVCYDVGFLLSYAATLGVLFSNVITKKLRKTKLKEKKLLMTFIQFALLPICATLATLPILIRFNLGVSVLGVFFNIIATPLLSVITTLTFASVLFATASIFTPIAFFIAFVNNIIITILLFITQVSTKIPWSLIYLNGLSMMLIVIFTYALIYLCIKYKPRYGAALTLLFIVATIAIQTKINDNLVNIAPTSKNQNASIIIWERNKAVLINREKTVDIRQLNNFLKKNKISSLDLIINLHEIGEGLNEINAKQIINIHDDVWYTYSYEPFTDIIVTVKKQDKGVAAIIDVKGFKALFNVGEYNFDKLPYSDVYFTGISRGYNICADNKIAAGNAPKWLDDEVYENATVIVNKGYSYKINEGFYGFD